MSESEDKKRKFAIFKVQVLESETLPTLQFTALPNLIDVQRPLELDAETMESAVIMATDLLKLLKARSHTFLYVGVGDVPQYVVGEIHTAHDPVGKYRNYHIHEFVPVHTIDEPE